MESKIKFSWSGLSHHKMVAKSLVTITSAKRDLELISDYGIDEAFISEFEAKVNNLDSLNEFKTEQALNFLVTQDKAEAKLSLIKDLQGVKRRFSMIYQVKSDIYSEFMTGDLKSSNNGNFIGIANRIVKGLELHLPILAKVGITSETIDLLKTKIADFKATSTTKGENLNESKKATEIRNTAMSDVYSDLSLICRAGKAVWIDESSAYYQEYILSK